MVKLIWTDLLYKKQILSTYGRIHTYIYITYVYNIVSFCVLVLAEERLFANFLNFMECYIYCGIMNCKSDQENKPRPVIVGTTNHIIHFHY